MKQFLFYFLVTLLFILCCMALLSWQIHPWFADYLRDEFIVAALFLLGLTLLSPTQMVKHTGGSLAQQRLFLPAAIAVWVIVAGFSLIAGFSSKRWFGDAVERYTGLIFPSLAVILVTGWVSFIFACFRVRPQLLTRGFRIQAIAAISWLLVAIVTIAVNFRADNVPGLMDVLLAANALAALPLLWLNYRLWRRGPEEAALTAAVAALGADQISQ
jgi:hypothetical protein